MAISDIRSLGVTPQGRPTMDWENVVLPKAVIPDPSGQSFSDIKFDLKPSFTTNYQPISSEHLSTSLSGAMKTLANPLESTAYNGEEFSINFANLTKGLPTGQVITAY